MNSSSPYPSSPPRRGVTDARFSARWLLVAMVLLASPAFAQTTAYPSKPIRLIVPYAPGGVADLMSRILAQRLGPLYNQQIVIDNRPGSGGHVGADIAVKAPPDGYTIVFATIAHNA